MDGAPFPGLERPYVNQDYIDALTSVSAVPVLLPLVPDEAVDRQLSFCDGLLLTGGYDMHPSFYGSDMHELLGATLSRLDRHQVALCARALGLGIPVLGICRGHQLLNVVRGGSLFQDISEQKGSVLKHFQKGERSDIAHSVAIEGGSKLEAIFGCRRIGVNSFHHQCVDRVGEGLRVVARSADGTVEASELAGHPFCLSVQWHPEMMLRGSASMSPLFAAFVAACGGA